MFNEEVAAAAAEFSGTFGLRSFPGKTGFWVNVSQSFVSNGEIQLYVFTNTGEAFAKGTPTELRSLIVGRIEKEEA